MLYSMARNGIIIDDTRIQLLNVHPVALPDNFAGDVNEHLPHRENFSASIIQNMEVFILMLSMEIVSGHTHFLSGLI